MKFSFSSSSSLLLLLFFSSSFILCHSYSWHAYNSHKSLHSSLSLSRDRSTCHTYESSSSLLPELTNKYKLWPNLSQSRHIESNGKQDNYTIYGFKYALDSIWKIQHPNNCHNQKFVINGFHNGGFGSELHVIGAAFGAAIHMERTFLLNPLVHPMVDWEFKNSFCQDQKQHNLDCYYEPMSSCTVTDALGPNAMTLLREAMTISENTAHGKDIYVTVVPSEWGVDYDLFKQHIIEKAKNYKVIILRNPGWMKHGVIPHQFIPLLHCSPVNRSFYYYWWRAVSLAYQMRPNERVIDWLKNYSIPSLDTSTDGYYSVYIRRGDKSVEMKLPPVSNFTHTLHLLSKYYPHSLGSSSTHNNSKSSGSASGGKQKLLFLASEDSHVIKSMKDWNENQHHHSKYSIYITEVFNRSGLLAERSATERRQPASGKKPDHHPLEYLSMLLNVHYLVKGTAYICTLSSNFCRVIDELRATVGGRADLPYADLSIESCSKPPCIYENIYDLDWR